MGSDQILTTGGPAVKYLRHDVFATTIMRFDSSEFFSAAEVNTMIDDIDGLIQQNKWLQTNTQTPKWQSLPVLWESKINLKGPWDRLQEIFLYGCHTYLNEVNDFVVMSQSLEPVGARAWFYKFDPNDGGDQPNPWHDHRPSMLSGVFYLNTTQHQNLSINGTEFRDPRGAGCSVIRDVALSPQTLGWVIFPGWLEHRTGVLDQSQSRHVVAADLYMKPRYEITD